MTTATKKPKPREPVTSEILDRMPPNDVTAEHCVLGSMLIHPPCCDDVLLAVRREDFYDDANAELFTVLASMWNEGKSIDISLVTNRLQKLKLFDNIGGPTHLARVVNAVPNAAHAVYYANIVRDKAVYRSLIYAGTEMLRAAYDEDGEASEISAKAEQSIFAVNERHVSEPRESQAVLLDAADEIFARKNGKATGGCSTGYRTLDAKIGGLRPGELIVIAGRPSMGKSALALNLAERASLNEGAATLYASLEMSAAEIGDRLLGGRGRIPLHKLRNGTLNEADMQKIVDAANDIGQDTLYIDDEATMTVSQIAAKARRLKRKKGLAVVVVDYLQLITPDDSRVPRQEQVATMTRQLKLMAKNVGVAVVLVAQLNRQTETAKDNRPRLSHLRESGAIEQDADIVIFVHRDAYYKTNPTTEEKRSAIAIVEKQRNGPTGDVPLLWFEEYTRFDEPAPARHSEFDDFNNG